MSLFRKNALDALSTPEKLDSPLELIKTRQWVLLWTLGGFLAFILIWSIFGKIPVRISGRGVLVRTNSLTYIQSESPGRVLKISTLVGDCIEKGDIIAVINPVKQELAKEEAELQVEQLLSQDQQEDGLGQIRVQQQKAEIARIESLVQQGAISLDQLSQRQKELSSLIDTLESRNGQREQQIQQQIARIKAKKNEIQRTTKIRSPLKGCIIDQDVHVGEVVQIGTSLFTIEKYEPGKKLESYAFFAAKDGKRLAEGQAIRVTPTSTKRQRHGGINGKIINIRQLPISDKTVSKQLGLESLLKSIQQEAKTPLIQVQTSLKTNGSTISGYDWGGGSGPNIKLTAGTPTEVRVLVEERRPISYVIPILRDLSGIY